RAASPTPREGPADGAAVEDGAVLERKQRRAVVADPGVHDGRGTGRWRRVRGERRHNHRASFPASRDRFAGLTGPASRTTRRLADGYDASSPEAVPGRTA